MMSRIEPMPIMEDVEIPAGSHFRKVETPVDVERE